MFHFSCVLYHTISSFSLLPRFPPLCKFCLWSNLQFTIVVWFSEEPKQSLTKQAGKLHDRLEHWLFTLHASEIFQGFILGIRIHANTKKKQLGIWCGYCCKIQGSNSDMLNSPETKVLLGMYRKFTSFWSLMSWSKLILKNTPTKEMLKWSFSKLAKQKLAFMLLINVELTTQSITIWVLPYNFCSKESSHHCCILVVVGKLDFWELNQLRRSL